MAIDYVNEASFELPELAVADRTVHVLELGGGAVPGLGLMLARAPFPVGKSLRDLVKAHTDQERLSLRSWSRVFEREGEVDVPNDDRIAERCRERTRASPGRANSPDYSGAFSVGSFE